MNFYYVAILTLLISCGQSSINSSATPTRTDQRDNDRQPSNQEGEQRSVGPQGQQLPSFDSDGNRNFGREFDAPPMLPVIPVNTAGLVESDKNLQGVDYIYQHSKDNIRPDRIIIKAKITNSTILEKRNSIIAVIGAFSLKDSSTPVYSQAKLTWDNESDLILEAEKFEPGTPYKSWVFFFEATGGNATAPIGAFDEPFFFATSGETKLSLARAKVAMNAFAEAYDWELNRYDRSKGYATWSWCVRFYEWNFNGIADVPRTVQTSAEQIKNLSNTESIIGDNARTPGHTFMLISYDKHINKFWSVDGNFNNRVLVWKRSPRGLGLGHMVDSQVN